MAVINGVAIRNREEGKVIEGRFAPRPAWVRWVIVVLLGLIGFGCLMVHEADRAADLREARFDVAYERTLRRLEREAMEAGQLEYYLGADGGMHIVGTPKSILDSAASRKRANGGPVAEKSAWSDEIERESARQLMRPYPAGGAPVVPYP